MNNREIFIAKNNFDEVIGFFAENLDEGSDAIFSEEFFCPSGLSAAVRRNQVVICKDLGIVVAGARFYPRKKDGITSLYQFAIDKRYRGKNLLRDLLYATGYKKFESACSMNAGFNEYYRKTGWKLGRKSDINNYWILDLN